MRTLITLAIALALLVVATLWWLREPTPSATAAAHSANGPRAAASESAAVQRTALDAAAAQRDLERGAVESPDASSREPAVTVADASVALTVVSKEDGRPVPAVRLIDLNAEGDAAAAVATDAAGRFDFTRPAGATLLLRCRPGEDEQDAQDLAIRDLKAGERREVVWAIALGPDLEFHGIVLARGQDGAALLASGAEAPIAKALVTVHEDDLVDHETQSHETHSDAGGRFMVRARSWRHPFIDVTAAGFGPAACTVQSGHAVPQGAERILLSASATLRGRVVDPRGGPSPKAMVSLSVSRAQIAQPAGEWPSFTPLEWRCATLADGRFELRDLPGAVDLDLSIIPAQKGVAPIELARALRLEPGVTAEREFRLGTLARIVGIVVDQDGTPVGGARLAAVPRGDLAHTLMVPALLKDPRRRFATSDESGAFTFEELPTGSWVIGVDTRAFAPQDERGRPPASPNLLPVEVPELATEVPVRLVVWRGLFLRGKVVDDRGEPVALAAVRARPAGDPGALYDALAVESGPEGAFELGPLPPGDFELFADGSDVGRGLTRSGPVHASPNGEPVTLTIPRVGGLIVARVVDRATALGVDAWVSAAFDGETLVANRADADGSIRLDVPKAGTWSLRATSRDGRIAVAPAVEVAAGGESRETRLELVPGATLVIHAPPASPDASFAVWLGDALVADDSFPDDRPARVTVPTGTLRVQFLVKPNPPSERVVAVDAGATIEVRSD